jgi:hypothetical protein
MVLAVDVGGDGAAHRDVAGAWGHRNEEAPGHELAHQRVEARPGAGPDHAGGGIEVEVDDAGGVDHPAAGVLGAVAVTAPEPTGDHATIGDLVERVAQVVGRRGSADERARRAGATPSGQQAATEGRPAALRVRCGRWHRRR